jgi:hypothetical protein
LSRKRTKGRLITGFVTRLTRRVPLVEQELLTLPEHLSSPPVISGVRVTRSLVLYVCFVDRWLSLCTSYFGHCVVCSSSIYGFWFPLWYLQTLLMLVFKSVVMVFTHAVLLNWLQSNTIIPWLYAGRQITQLFPDYMLADRLHNYSLTICWQTDYTIIPWLYAGRLQELFQLCFIEMNCQRRYRNVALGRETFYLHSDFFKIVSKAYIIKMVWFFYYWQHICYV